MLSSPWTAGPAYLSNSVWIEIPAGLQCRWQISPLSGPSYFIPVSFLLSHHAHSIYQVPFFLTGPLRFLLFCSSNYSGFAASKYWSASRSCFERDQIPFIADRGTDTGKNPT